ncbi:sulfatase [Verrucomicrobiota bacterium]
MINRRSFLKMFALTAAGIPVIAAAASKPKPNFIFFLADDLGWTDLGGFGSSFYESPNIDKLCAEGMKFTASYCAGSVCSPTRSSIITGRVPARTGCTQFGGSVSGKEYCFAQDLEKAGYATFFTGKWHVGGKSPTEAGFSISMDLKRNKNLQDDPKGTGLITKNTMEFLRGVKDQPFFAYVNYHAVHAPAKERQEIVDKYQKKLKSNPPKPGEPRGLEVENRRSNKQVQDDAAFAAMIDVMDSSVREILEEVKAMGAEENTVVIFSSENGGFSTTVKGCTSNLPLRAGKGWLYEGGIRVPTIIKWPAMIKANSVCDVPINSTDFYPTILEIAGLPLRPEDHCDGLSLVNLLKTGIAPARDAMYWHYPHHHGSGNSPSGAVRMGDYMLIHYFETDVVELYNVKEDISQLTDLAKSMPEKTDEMLQTLKTWQKTIPGIVFEETEKSKKKKAPKGK